MTQPRYKSNKSTEHFVTRSIPDCILIVCQTYGSRAQIFSISKTKSPQWVKLSEGWPKFKIFEFHDMLKSQAKGQNKVHSRTKMFGSIRSRYRQTNRAFYQQRVGRYLVLKNQQFYLLNIITVTIYPLIMETDNGAEK